MLNEDELKDAVLLVLANKQDIPNVMSPAEVTQKLQLQNYVDRKWFVQGTCATNADGLYDGLNWLADALQQRS